MSYNIHRGVGVDRRFRLERIVEIVGHHEPDILLLQEVDDGVPRSCEIDLASELARLLHYPHLAVGHNVKLRRGRYGNATLSRYDIFRERNIDLTDRDRKRRGCQHASIRIHRATESSREIEVFNLHLGLSARERMRQIRTLVRSEEFTRLDPRSTCLVGGDFNDWRSQLHPVFTDGLGFRCATRRNSSNGSIRTYPAFSPTGGLDKLFYRGGLRLIAARRCRLGVSRVASDHLPVIADFELS